MNTFTTILKQKLVYSLLFLLPSVMLIAQTDCSNSIEISEGYEADFSISSNTSEFTEVSSCGESSAYLFTGAVKVFKYTTTENIQSIKMTIKSGGQTGIGVFTDCTENSLGACIDFSYLDSANSGDLTVDSGEQSAGTDLYFVVGREGEGSLEFKVTKVVIETEILCLTDFGVEISPVSAPEEHDGTISISVITGLLPIQATLGPSSSDTEYENNTFTINSYGDYNWSNLPSGSYTVFLIDAGDCNIAKFIEVGIASTNIEIVSCSDNPTSYPGATDGAVTIEVSGVSSQIMGFVGGTATFFDNDGTYTFGQLPAGTHEVILYESGEQVATCEVTIIDGEIDVCEDPLGLAGEDKVICVGETTTIGCEPVEGYCYYWHTNFGLLDASVRNSSMFDVSPAETTTYYLIITNGEGDIVTEQEIEVIIENEFEVSLGEDITVCQYEVVELSGIVDTDGTYNYLWSTGETSSSIFITSNRTKDYSVTVTDMLSNCQSSDEIRVITKMSPDIYIRASYPSICDTELPAKPESSKILSDCNQTIVNLNASTGLSGFEYLWSTGSTESSIDTENSGEYSVTVTNPAGCSSETIYYLETCLSSFEIIVSFSENDGEVILDAGLIEYSTYEWSTGNTSSSILINEPGEYSVTVTDNNGCTATDIFKLNDIGYEPEEVFTIMTTRGVNCLMDVYICNNGVYTENDKEKIQNLIKESINPSLDSDCNFNSFYWTCNPYHSTESPIIHSRVVPEAGGVWQNFYSIVIKQDGDVYTSERFYLVTTINEYKFYDFELTINSGAPYLATSSSSESGISKFNISPIYYDFPDEITAKFRAKDYNSNFQDITEMSIIFQGHENVEENDDYFIFKEGININNNTIEEEEKSVISFTIKKQEETGEFVDLSQDEIQDLIWYVNGSTKQYFGTDGVGLENDMNEVFVYSVPPFETEAVPLNVTTSKGGSVSIVVTEKPFFPGIDIADSEEDNLGTARCVNYYNPDDLINEALTVINDASAAPNPNPQDMYEMLDNTYQIELVKVDRNHPKISPVPGSGIVNYGSNDFDWILSERIQIDNNFSISGNEDGCPTNGNNIKILLLITEAEKGLIDASIVDGLSEAYPPVVNRIEEVYPELGVKIKKWCDLEGITQEDALSELNIEYEAKMLKYEGSDTEIENEVSFGSQMTVFLAVDNIYNCANYAKRAFDFDNPIGSTPEEWYGSADCDDIRNHRKRRFENTITHELAHIYYKVTNKVEAFKWFKLRNHLNFPDEFICYDDNTCGEHKGHEIGNPDGISTCEMEERFPLLMY